MDVKFLVAFSLLCNTLLASQIQSSPFSDYRIASIDIDQTMDQPMLCDEEKALLYLSCGYSNLLSKDYQAAFDDYKKSINSLTYSNDSGLEFLTTFGMVVTCDNLHLINTAEEYMLRIRHLIDTCVPEENDVIESIPKAEGAVANHLRHLANMSNSTKTKTALLSLVSEIFPSSLTRFSGSGQRFAPPFQTTFEIQSCRSFWKTLKKIRDSIVETWNSFFKIYKEIKEIKEDFNSWNTQQEV